MGRLAINPPAEAGGIPESKNPFASSRFTIWWLASMVAGTGVGIQTVTVPLFVRDRVDLEVRGLAIAAALIAQTLPGALLVLVGGAMADRAERHRILARTYSIAALVSTLYVLLSGLDVRTIWPVFPLAAIVGSAGAFTNPARQSMLPQLVTRAQLQNGVIFGTMGFIATLQFLGPTVAGLVVDSRGLTAAFGLEVVMLAAGAVLFSRLPTSPPEATGATVFGDLIEGLRYIRREPALLGLLLLGTVIGVCFIGPFSVTVPPIVPDILGATDKWVGILWGCFGLAVCLSILLGGVLYVLYGLSEILLLSAALQLAAGLNASVFMNYAVSLLQEHTAPRMMGRVMSMYSFAFFASMPIGYAQAGIVTSLFGPQTTLVSAGLLAAVIGLACVTLLRPVRALE
jgi:MFS family permease